MSNDKPKYDFATELQLGPDDVLEGYNLFHEGEWYDLHAVEAAFEAADQKGLAKGALLAYPDGLLVTVVGRNATVRHEDEGASHYPVVIQQFDDFQACGIDNLLRLVPLPVKVVATSSVPLVSGQRSQPVTGELTAVEVDDRRGATVVIDHRRYLLRDLLELRLA